MVLNNEVELEFDEFKVDSSERLLSYIRINSVDIGEDMILEGLTLAFPKYPFSRINQYLRAQRTAREAKKGIWGNARLEKRAIDLQKLWTHGGE
jgi:endonuclease YncB( thermonuclease family)